ncbi:c6 zinc finger domain-containing protein [Colletotrichum tabaci]|uniref:C6 zinc finger domain-containing protein n=1 Tax=Colletotrichum tabaci TaxID=1209068 RepID=A0AAV9SVN4_9PEZI
MDPAHAADTASTSTASALSPRTAPSLAGSLESENGTGVGRPPPIAYRPRHTRTSTPKVRTGCVTF